MSHRLGQELCRSWGLDPYDVLSITIRFDAKEPLPYATVELLGNEETMRVLLDLAPVAVTEADL